MSLLRFAEPHVYTSTDDSLVLWISGRGRGVGSKVFDLSKKGNHGAIHGACWKNTQLGHSALSFDGVDDYVEVPDSESLNITDEITIEAWVKVNLLGGSLAWQGIVGKTNFGSSPSNYHFAVVDDGHVGVGFYNSGWKELKSNTIIETGKWYHLAGVIVSGSKLQIFINGVLDNETTTTYEMLSNDYPLYLGKHGEYFNGTIGEVRIYNRALSAEEIRELYNKTKHLYGY